MPAYCIFPYPSDSQPLCIWEFVLTLAIRAGFIQNIFVNIMFVEQGFHIYQKVHMTRTWGFRLFLSFLPLLHMASEFAVWTMLTCNFIGPCLLKHSVCKDCAQPFSSDPSDHVPPAWTMPVHFLRALALRKALPGISGTPRNCCWWGCLTEAGGGTILSHCCHLFYFQFIVLSCID